jgi:hypothetical protein
MSAFLAYHYLTVSESGAVYYTNLAKRKVCRAVLEGDRPVEASDAGIAFDGQADDTRGESDTYVASKQPRVAYRPSRSLPSIPSRSIISSITLRSAS